MTWPNYLEIVPYSSIILLGELLSLIYLRIICGIPGILHNYRTKAVESRFI